MTGFLVTENARLIGCSYFNNYTYRMDNVTVIDHRSGLLSLSDCQFRKTSPNAVLYRGDGSGVKSRNTIPDGFENETI